MSQKVLYSIIESPLHPNLVDLYHSLNIENVQFNSMRKAISHLKKQQPDFVVADFIYGYGNNYAGVNVSNLDVFLHSLQKYAPEAKVIVMVEKEELKHVSKLVDLFTLHAVLQYPVSKQAMTEMLE
jgi:DNA-binding NarL/FixJ family response regulator